jgi:hypothetical protein
MPEWKKVACLHAGISLGLFNPKHGSNIFLQKVSWLSTDYMALCPEKSTLQNCDRL